jgi:N-acetylglucosamine malate deacetylase 1
MSTILVVAPHPDDETLGCGGTLLRGIADGARAHWAIASTMSAAPGYAESRTKARESEIEQVAAAYGFASVERGTFPAARLDTIPIADRVAWLAGVIARVRPETMYLPYPHDAHSDHGAVFDAAIACTKAFRFPSVRRVYCYETISETEFAMRPGMMPFHPNRFVDIAAHLDRKIEIMSLFAGEMAAAPFPRSPESIRALAAYRGAVAGSMAAEAFMLLREIV